MTVIASPPIDRAAAVRRALTKLVAERGFHGASMAAVAKEAGVATGTAYVYYSSKDDLVLATYSEIKRDLADAAAAQVAPSANPAERFRMMWLGVHAHLAADPKRARFLVQVDGSPYARHAHETTTASAHDPLVEATELPDMAAVLVDLPFPVLFDLGFGPAIRTVANQVELDRDRLDRLAASCWQAITNRGAA